MNQPQGYLEKGKEDQVFYLDLISKFGFNKSSYDSCAYINLNSYSSKIYLLLYVDDMLLVGKSKANIKRVR